MLAYLPILAIFQKNHLNLSLFQDRYKAYEHGVIH
jgi:hypothetical protein